MVPNVGKTASEARGQRAAAAIAIATPSGRATGLARLLTLRRLPWWAARIGIGLAHLWGRPFRIGRTIIAARHGDVQDGLARDLDFRIEPVNAPRFDQIGYHFILGMDRSAELIAERRQLYAALARVDGPVLRKRAGEDIARHLAAAGAGPIDAIADYARPIAAATASRIFGIGADPGDRPALMDATRAIFGNSFLNPAGDAAMAQRALAAGNMLSDWFEAEIARRHAAGNPGTDMMGQLLAAGAGDDLTRRTLGGMLVGAIDTTATCVARIMTVLVSDGDLLARARRDAGDIVRVWGWCNEALRRWPHGPALVRKATADTALGGTAVRAGDSVIFWTQAAMLDGAAFPEPLAMRPDRADAVYLHFGGGLHPCAGRGVNAWQIPMLVAGLLARDPLRLGPLRWAGPFPAHLPLYFKG